MTALTATRPFSELTAVAAKEPARAAWIEADKRAIASMRVTDNSGRQSSGDGSGNESAMETIVRQWRRNRPAARHRLRVLRERAELSQLALATASGVTNDTISRLELGWRSPRALGVAPERFIFDEADEASALFGG